MTSSGRDSAAVVVDLFLRRTADEPRRWRKPRASYEVGAFLRGGVVPISIQRTRRPSSVLVHLGVHTSDVGDYVRNADDSWRGGVGPWRDLYPEVVPPDDGEDG